MVSSVRSQDQEGRTEGRRIAKGGKEEGRKKGSKGRKGRKEGVSKEGTKEGILLRAELRVFLRHLTNQFPKSAGSRDRGLGPQNALTVKK